MHNDTACVRGKRVVLVPYLPQHVPRYHEWMSDPTLQKLTCSEPLTFDEEVVNQVEWLKSDDKLTFIILMAGTDADNGNGMRRLEMLGDCNCFIDPRDTEVAEVEVSLSEVAYRQLAVAQEVTQLLMTYVAKEVKRRTFEAKILTENAASIALFRDKLGFAFHRELKVFDESHFRCVLESDSEVEQLERDCGYMRCEYLYSPDCPARGHHVVGSIEAASEGIDFRYLVATWEVRACMVAARVDLLRHSKDASVPVHAPAVIAAGVELSREQPNDHCGAIAAFIGGPTGRRVAIAHSGHPNALYVQQHLVAIRDILPGEAILVNLNATLAHNLKYPFPDAPFTRFWDSQQPVGGQPVAGQEGVAALLTKPAGSAEGGEDPVVVGRGLARLPEAYRSRWMSYADAAVRRVAYEHDGFVPASTCPALVEVRQAGAAGYTTFAKVDIAEGTVLWDVKGIALPFPTVYTLCVAEGVHVLFNCDAQCLGHSCDPNVRIVVPSLAAPSPQFSVVVTRAIPAGEIIAFDYLTTEWDMNEPFECACGAANCRGKVEGFFHLSETAKAELLPLVTPAVRQLHDSRLHKDHIG
jgi:RimJ/RimL family protein N-acetyltransferase